MIKNLEGTENYEYDDEEDEGEEYKDESQINENLMRKSPEDDLENGNHYS